LIQLYRWFPSILQVLTIIRPENCTVRDRARVIDRDVVKQAPGRLNVARLRLRRPEEAESQHDEDSIAKRQRMETDHNAPSNSRTVTLRSARMEAVQLEPF
jgi:hypothetical protein